MIRIFSGANRFLSNFYYHDGWTVEHMYQAAKTNSPDGKLAILNASTPSAAKKLGRTVALRSDWEEIKDEVMLKLLLLKFKIPAMRRKLLDTGHQELEEGNYWHDNEWGSCYCMKCRTIPGNNKLGKLLMKVRSYYSGVEDGLFAYGGDVREATVEELLADDELLQEMLND